MTSVGSEDSCTHRRNKKCRKEENRNNWKQRAHLSSQKAAFFVLFTSSNPEDRSWEGRPRICYQRDGKWLMSTSFIIYYCCLLMGLIHRNSSTCDQKSWCIPFPSLPSVGIMAGKVEAVVQAYMDKSVVVATAVVTVCFFILRREFLEIRKLCYKTETRLSLLLNL